jgi:hypothetical protein
MKYERLVFEIREGNKHGTLLAVAPTLKIMGREATRTGGYVVQVEYNPAVHDELLKVAEGDNQR